MLVKRNVSRSSDTILPTTCPTSRHSASTAWPILLGALVVGALVFTAATGCNVWSESQPAERRALSADAQPAAQRVVPKREPAVSVLECADTKPMCAAWARA